MTLVEAIRKAEREVGGYVIGLGECADRWIFGFDFEEDALTSVVWCCDKETEEIFCFFPPDEPDVLKSVKPLELPEEFQNRKTENRLRDYSFEDYKKYCLFDEDLIPIGVKEDAPADFKAAYEHDKKLYEEAEERGIIL